MFAKYTMTSPDDYRGNVALVKRDLESNQDIAYTAIDELTPDMIELTAEERQLVKSENDGLWLTERQLYQRKIDLIADEIRVSYLQKGPRSVVEEYAQVEQAAREWAAIGKPADNIPIEISLWAEISGKGVEWAYNNIVSEADMFRSMLLAVRELRLRGKEAMRILPADQLKPTFDVFIEQLESLRAPVDY